MELLGLIGNWLSDVGPRLTAGFTFMPCGLLMGYTLTSLTSEKQSIGDYGPLILGGITALLTAILYYILKLMKKRIIYCHIDMLLVTVVVNILASILFFIPDLDDVGAYIGFIGYGITYITTLSYLNMISSKTNRAILLLSCFVWYLIGLSASISLITDSIERKLLYDDSLRQQSPSVSMIRNSSLEILITKPSSAPIFNKNLIPGIYNAYAGLYLSLTLLIGILLVLIKVFHFMGNLDYKMSLDNEIRVANSNDTIFDNRNEIIKRVQFFYVTKSKQLMVSFVQLFCDAIHFSMFIYFISWCTLNDAINLTHHSTHQYDIIWWLVFLGSFTAIIPIIFVSMKVIFVVTSLLQIGFVFLAMILYVPNGNGTQLIPIWIVFYLYGLNFGIIKASISETGHLMFNELLVAISCIGKLAAIAIINASFITDSKNSMFYLNEQGALVAHALAFNTITALITIIIIIQMPRTHKTSLFDIQYSLMGMIFQKHQIEQLNERWLKDGTIPTITRNIEAC